MSNIVIAALYHFAPLEATEEFRADLDAFCTDRDIRGILILAGEGINGTVCGSRSAINDLLSRLHSLPGFEDIEHKESFADAPVFKKLRVRIKREIVTIRRPEADPTKSVGTYVSPAEWNELISDPDVVVIDTRNSFEYGVGTFARAEDPGTVCFAEFPEYVETRLAEHKDKKIAMFCTGGIRCEKATSLLLESGFQDVFHLKGGILKYLEEIPKDESLWDGECFVFDQRITVDHDLKQGSYDMRDLCGHPMPVGTNPDAEPCPFCAKTPR